jgi:hypothetical protein
MPATREWSVVDGATGPIGLALRCKAFSPVISVYVVSIDVKAI